MEITKYQPQYENKLVSLLAEDPDWESFVTAPNLEKFRQALQHSNTYLLLDDTAVCGYIRAVVDAFGVYVSELYVCPGCRHSGYGRALLNRIKSDNRDNDVYVLSDEDGYYRKQGFERAGSIFQL